MNTGTASPRDLRWALAAAVAVAIYAVILCAVCHLKYAGFGYRDFDLAVHAQSVNNIAHGSLDSSILGIPFLGNHMVLILFLVAPLYAVLPSPLVLLYLQAIALALGGWAVFRIARRELHAGWGLLFTLAYLTHPPLIQMNLYEFHPVALASTFLLFTFDAYRARRFAPFCAFAALAMLCQENIPLIVAGFGILAAVDRRGPRWIAAPLGAGFAAFFLAVGVVMPRLNTMIRFDSIYAHLGGSLPEAAMNIIIHPFRALGILLEPAKLNFLNQLMGPLGYLSLLSPASLIPLAPAALQRLLSARGTETAMVFHYQAEFIPFVFGAAAVGAANLLRLTRGHRLARLMLGSALVVLPALAFLLGRVVPTLATACRSPWTPPVQARIERLVDEIPADASVIATFEFQGRLSDRRALNSLHHVYTGHYTLSTTPFPTPGDADYLLMNALDRLTFRPSGFYGRDDYRRLQDFLATGRWDVVDIADSVILLRRAATGVGSYPTGLVASAEAVTPGRTSISLSVPGSVTVEGYDIGERDADGLVPLTLYWRVTAPPAEDFNAVLCLRAGVHEEIVAIAPGHRLWPPQSWPQGRVVIDRQRIPLGAALASDPALQIEVVPVPVVASAASGGGT